jgi:addiction module HigA family antidote
MPKPITPGDILLQEFMIPLGLGSEELCEATGISKLRLCLIIEGNRPITTEDAKALASYFGNSKEFWLNLNKCARIQA